MLIQHGLRRRRALGFTLNEIIISMTILGIIGVAATKVLQNQSRFFDMQQNMRASRSIARNSMNVILSDLRMVQDSGGVDSAATDGKTIRVLVPYWFGVVCGVRSGKTIVMMLPADSTALAMSTFAGYAWRNSSTGRYTIVTPSDPTGGDAPVASTNATVCTGTGSSEAQMKSISINGRTSTILDLSSNVDTTVATAGTPVFFFQKVTYSFKSSGMYSGYQGLWRTVKNGTDEELMAPFDTSSRFKFWEQAEDTSRTATPSLALIRGIDLVMVAMSPKTTSVRSAEKTKVTTAIFFKNVRSY